MDDFYSVAEKQKQRLAAWFNSISTRGPNGARLEDASYDHPQMVNSSNSTFTPSYKLDMKDLVEDAVSGDVFLEESKMRPVSQRIVGCEESENQEEQKKHLRKEESETKSDYFSEYQQKIFEKQNEHCEEDLQSASILLSENFISIMVSAEDINVDRQEIRQST
ncbi:hypothetical protein PIB30_067339 [Stylosanthes scabra]|uniref:Uncharacterized protein n=1 Tax=Stylosanthes scabra TaxID=79078 RepID=A0ABU6WKX2_9FABA|nr:hypothetical protein [Stylosanthes scabra]